MLGPLPPAHRIAVVLATVALCVAGALLLITRFDLPPGGPALGLGLGLGVTLAFALVRESRRPVPRPQRVRVRR